MCATGGYAVQVLLYAPAAAFYTTTQDHAVVVTQHLDQDPDVPEIIELLPNEL